MKRPTLPDQTVAHLELLGDALRIPGGLPGVIQALVFAALERYGINPVRQTYAARTPHVRATYDQENSPGDSRTPNVRAAYDHQKDETGDVRQTYAKRTPNVREFHLIGTQEPAPSLAVLDPDPSSLSVGSETREETPAPIAELIAMWNELGEPFKSLGLTPSPTPSMRAQLSAAWREAPSLDLWRAALGATKRLPRYAIDKAGLTRLTRLLDCPGGGEPPARFLWLIADGKYEDWGPRERDLGTREPPPGSNYAPVASFDAAFHLARTYGRSMDLGVRLALGDGLVEVVTRDGAVLFGGPVDQALSWLQARKGEQ